MLNLLIISDNIKADTIMVRLQPMISAKIDILGDFDLGLKEVFEKRPATVIIQNQISGVAADSVIRHIQMLLGTGAPKFILIHDGLPSVKPLKGLYDHVIDLNMPAKQFFEALLTMLKTVYGEQWEKVFVVTDSPALDLAEKEVLSANHAEAANRLVEELFSDLHAEVERIEAGADSGVAGPVIEGSDVESVNRAIKNEEIAALLVETADESRQIQLASEKMTTAQKADLTGQDEKTGADLPKSSQEEVRFQNKQAAAKTRPVAAAAAVNNGNLVRPELSEVDSSMTEPTPSELAKISEDILLSFEQNYRADSSQWKTVAVIAVIIAGIAVAGWYLLKEHPGWLSFFDNKQPLPVVTAPKSVIPAPTATAAVSGGNLQKPVSSTARPQQNAGNSLPSFIPADSRDLSFKGKGPGWERYLTVNHDFRLFRSNGWIKAIQVLAVKGHPITDQFLKSVLQEITGSNELKPLSRIQRQDVILQRYGVNTRGELLIYRNKSNDSIIAFVVSLD